MIKDILYFLSSSTLTVACSTVGLVSYLVYYIYKRKTYTELKLTDAVSISSSYATILVSMRLVLLSMDSNIVFEENKINPTILYLAGITTIWFGISNIIDKYKSVNSNKVKIEMHIIESINQKMDKLIEQLNLDNTGISKSATSEQAQEKENPSSAEHDA